MSKIEGIQCDVCGKIITGEFVRIDGIGRGICNETGDNNIERSGYDIDFCSYECLNRYMKENFAPARPKQDGFIIV